MAEEGPYIVVDFRESSFVIDELRRLGARISLDMIAPGDYVVAKDFAIERKTFGDFLRSIFDKRLFEQIERLGATYKRHCLVVEGNVGQALVELRNPLVFWGALGKIIADHNTPLVFTLNEQQTAQFIFSLAKKCQEKKERLVARYKPKVYSLAEAQLLAVQGLPGVGPKMAERLLRRFGTVRRVFAAKPSELRMVEGVGRKRAEAIAKFLDAPYLYAERALERSLS